VSSPKIIVNRIRKVVAEFFGENAESEMQAMLSRGAKTAPSFLTHVPADPLHLGFLSHDRRRRLLATGLLAS